MKSFWNSFYFTLNVLFVLKIINFCPDFFGYAENALIRKLKLISKLMTLQTAKLIISWKMIHRIWWRKIFSWKIKIKHSSRSTVWTFIRFVFIVCPIWKLPKYIEIKVLTTCFYLTKSFFKKQKEIRNYLSWFISCVIFEEKHFSCYILLADQTSL